MGGYALAFHSVPRFTKVLDVWTDPTPENARLVIDALRDFGAPTTSLEEADLAHPGTVFQIGVAPNRIDIITAIDGVVFADAWPARMTATYGDQPIGVIGRAHLIANNRATGRRQDLLDTDLLERINP